MNEPKSLTLGGLVGEETIEGPEVPFTQDNAADRINPITGLPYNQPAYYSTNNMNIELMQMLKSNDTRAKS